MGLSEAARRLGLGKSHVAYLVKQGKLKAVRTRVGSRHCWRIDLSSASCGRQADLLDQIEASALLLTLNCLNGFFHFPPFDSLSEALLKAEGKGAIAAFSPSGLSRDEAAHVYHMALLAEIASHHHARLGDALLAAQSVYADSGPFPELLAIYHLFGDPAMRLR